VCQTAKFLSALEGLLLEPPGCPAGTNPGASSFLVLEPNRIEKQYWKDLWRYRELFAIMAWRNPQGSP
jgi:hypothetical protein